MSSLRDWIGTLHSQGQPVRAGEWTITPVSKASIVQIPGLLGGFVWNRPAYVRVSAPDQPDRVLPVHDLTRMIVWWIAGLAVLGVLLARLIIRKESQ
jgi:hypothetical protein